MEYNGVKFLERLKEVAGNKTQEQISKEIRVDTSTISRWSKTIPKTENLIVIAKTYNCSIDYLLDINELKFQTQLSLLDIIKELFICDMQGSTDCFLVFKSEDFSRNNFEEGQIIFENNLFCDGTPHNINYGEMFDKYSKMKEAFAFIEDEQIKISMITTLVNQYKLPFIKRF